MLLIEPGRCRGHLVHHSYFRAELFGHQIGSEVSAYKPSPWEGGLCTQESSADTHITEGAGILICPQHTDMVLTTTGSSPSLCALM